MSRLSVVVRTLYPVDARGSAGPRKTGSGRSSLLQQVMAVCFAAAPLLVLIEAIAETA